MYRAVTRNIEVTVEPFYLAERSDASESRYVWAYRITIVNNSDDLIQLLTRYWHITDGNGTMEEVLDPGDSYQYTSGCPLTTPTGFMVGHYTMRDREGALFDVRIPAFSLDLPGEMHTVN